MGNTEQKIEINAENAALTFPNIGTVFDVQENIIQVNNQNQKLYSYLLSAFDYVPEPIKPVYLLKYAFTYVGIGVTDNQGLIDSRIRRYLTEQLYNLLSAELAEINRRLQVIEISMNQSGNTQLYTDVSYCISRCAVLLDLFRNNLNYALGMATLFKQVSLIYITLGLTLVLYDRNQKQNILNRFVEIENCVNAFADATILQRLERVRYIARFPNDPKYMDEMRPDMGEQTLILVPHSDTIGDGFDAALPDLALIHNERVENTMTDYRNRLRELYSEYFQKINTEALRPARIRIQQVR